MESERDFFAIHLGSKYLSAIIRWMARGTRLEDHVSSCPCQTRTFFGSKSLCDRRVFFRCDLLFSWRMKTIIVNLLYSSQQVEAENVPKLHQIEDVDRFLNKHVWFSTILTWKVNQTENNHPFLYNLLDIAIENDIFAGFCKVHIVEHKSIQQFVPYEWSPTPI